MILDGKAVASQIKTDLRQKISFLRQKNIFPHLAVVLIGNDPGSEAYVRQKLKVGEEIGAKVTLIRLQPSDTKENLIKIVEKLNSDESVHGIIVQRPSPIDIAKEELDVLVAPKKDVDGFHPESPFTPPVANAVLKILEWVYKNGKDTSDGGRQARSAHHDSSEVEEFSKNFTAWLKKQKILVIGRGETAGHPIAETLKRITDKITIAHSQTPNVKELCLASDIIITCVGRANIVRHNMLLPSTLLIGVGLHQEDGKLATDYDQEEIAGKVAYYTPVPGGVGPVNVACLFENLVISCGTARGSS